MPFIKSGQINFWYSCLDYQISLSHISTATEETSQVWAVLNLFWIPLWTREDWHSLMRPITGNYSDLFAEWWKAMDERFPLHSKAAIRPFIFRDSSSRAAPPYLGLPRNRDSSTLHEWEHFLLRTCVCITVNNIPIFIKSPLGLTLIL